MTDQSKRTPRDYWILKEEGSNRALIRDPGEKWQCDIDGEPHSGWTHIREVTSEPTFTLSEILPLVEALEHAMKKHKEHMPAYGEDIFPDDKREACQTTAGRMGRHMLRVYGHYLEPAEKALAQFQKLMESRK